MNYQQQLLNELHYNANIQSSAMDTDATRALIRAGHEAYEKCAAAYRAHESIIVSKRNDLGDAAINPDYLFPLSLDGELDAEQRSILNEEPIAWTPAWSLTHETTRWIPAACCYFGFPQKQTRIYAHSRGLAAGPSLEFCILNGIAELMETLAVSRWKQHGMQAPEVDLTSFEDPLFTNIPTIHYQKGRDLWMVDLSQFAETPFHVFAVLSHAPRQHTLLEGTAASYKANKAMRSALLECTQMLPNLLLSDEEKAVSRSIAFHVPAYKMPDRVRYDQRHYHEAEQPAISLRSLIHHLKKRRIEVLVKDLTRQAVPINAVRVMFSLEDC